VVKVGIRGLNEDSAWPLMQMGKKKIQIFLLKKYLAARTVLEK
jgi:hypothetical protein